jgi:uncharacterized protein (TIGR03083 family)
MRPCQAVRLPSSIAQPSISTLPALGVGIVAAVTGGEVLRAAELVERTLEAHQSADWSAPVPGLDFTVASVVAHLAGGLLWYSVDLWSGRADAAFDVQVRADAPNDSLVTSMTAAARALAAGIDAAPPDTRGFHPFGSPDPAGFAAMACDELLVHGDDAARGLGGTFTPDRRLVEGVLARLFPWHAVNDDDAWDVMLWANGRIDLPGREPQRRWRWHTPPLREWDGGAVRA